MTEINRTGSIVTVYVLDTEGKAQIIAENDGYMTPVKVTALRGRAGDKAQTRITMVMQSDHGPQRFSDRSTEPVEDIMVALKEAGFKRPAVTGQTALGAFVDKVIHRHPPRSANSNIYRT